MSKELVKKGSFNLILGLGLLALLIWLVMKNKSQQQYLNSKTWEIEYNNDGLPVKITKHVKATYG